MKKIITIISIFTLIFLVACGGSNTGKSAAELAPEGMNELTFGYGYTAYQTIEDYLKGDTTAETAKTLVNGLNEKLNELDIPEDDTAYGYNLSVGSYLDQFTFYLDYGSDEDIEESLNGLKEVLQIE